MNSQFWSYYPLTDEQMAHLSSQAVIVLDAGAILHSYRLSPSTSDAWRDLLEELGDRVWVPYQAADEYVRNRLSAVGQAWKTVTEVEGLVVDAFDELVAAVDKKRADIKRSPVLEPDAINRALTEARDLLKARIAEGKTGLVDRARAAVGDDHIHRRITAVLGPRVGSPFDDQKLQQVYDEGKKRFERKIPPGHRDTSKGASDVRQYGDLVIWKQLIEHCRSEGKPAVFITEDTKDDWWYSGLGNTLGPQPALRQEFHSEVGEHYWQYRVSQFMRQAEHFGATAIEDTITDEAAAHEEAVGQEDTSDDDTRSARMAKLIAAIELAQRDSDANDELIGMLVSLLEGEFSS